MKICWDNLEKMKFNGKDLWTKGHAYYIYKNACKHCGTPYLTIKHQSSKFCSITCAQVYAQKGKIHSEETKKRLSKALKGKNIGKKHSVWFKKNQSERMKKRLTNPINHPCYIDGRCKNMKQYQEKWRFDNKGKVNANSAKRRAIKLQATPSWADLDYIEDIYKICSNMNQRAGKVLFHVDHIIPLQGKTVCGLHVENNLQILFARENLSKSNKLMEKSNG